MPQDFEWKLRHGRPVKLDDVQIEIFNAEKYEEDFPPENALTFIEWLKGIVESIQEAYRASVSIKINSAISYDEPYATVAVTYRRPETDEEFGARIAEYEAALRQKEAFEKADLSACPNSLEQARPLPSGRAHTHRTGSR